MGLDVYLVNIHLVSGEWRPFAICGTEPNARETGHGLVSDDVIGFRCELMKADKAIELLLKGTP